MEFGGRGQNFGLGCKDMRCCGDKGWGGEGQVTCGQRCGCDAEMSCGRLEMEDGRWKIEDGR